MDGEYLAGWLREAGWVRVTGLGSSMLPFLRPGDEILVVRPGELHVGDVVFARVGDRYVVHRLLLAVGDRLLLKGDGNLEFDGWINKTGVLGVMTSRFRDGVELAHGSEQARHAARIALLQGFARLATRAPMSLMRRLLRTR